MPSVFFEFTQIGDIVRVSAMDEETGQEVVIQGPAQAGRAELQRVAANKLRYVLRKMREAQDETQ